MDALVDVEKRNVSKLFVAVGAGKWVGWHLLQEQLLTDMGDYDYDYLMATPMACQGLLGGTLFATILTHKALLFMISHMSGKC